MVVKPGKKLTPMMERYLEVKRQHPQALLLFRMGDFYELFYEDAETAAKVLGLTLTSRDKGSSNPVPMAGFPYHALENYLQKLIHAGFRTAICDQVEDPKKAKGLVKREVTRIVTPGTLTDDALLDPRASNFLAAIHFDKERVGCAWLELSTGEFLTSTLKAGELLDEISRIDPAECLIAENVFQDHAEIVRLLKGDRATVTERPDWCFAARECERILCEHFGTKTLEGFDLESGTPAVTAAGALLDYIRETQKTSLGHINTIKVSSRIRNLQIDEATRRSLELTVTLREGHRQGSLLDTIDRTVSPMGARLFADWLSNPLTEKDRIERRLDTVEEFTKDRQLCSDLRDSLKRVYDLQRLTSRIATQRANPRDLRSLSSTLEMLPAIKAKLTARKTSLLQLLEEQIDLCEDVRAEIENTLVEEPPLQLTDGGAIRRGFHRQLDEFRDLAKGGKEWMAAYQAKEMERTGIRNLKIGFNRVFGYYLEVTAAQAEKVPEDYIRKQTLKNQERYITPELKDYEEKVLKAEEQAVALEFELFQQLRESVNRHCARLQKTAHALAVLDVLSSLAELAVKAGYCRAELTDEPLLDIREGRHPVLDALQPSGPFVPNDVRLLLEASPNTEKSLSQLQIVTGPNMAGKSTYIRQAALLTVMAQMGSFIPASEARVGICDRIFARVGASDELSKGQSTFMVEMTETARILNSATNRSLVILDEIGRGTSTYDGISLAWAVTEYLHDKIGCRTLFATHYHELTELSQTLSRVTNWNVAVQENRDEVIFLHKIVEGTADKSYGIHVARLAGIPAEVIQRSRIILETLECDHLDETGKPKIPNRAQQSSSDRQLALFQKETHPVLDELREMDLDRMTPLSALQELHRLRAGLGPDKESS